MCYEYDWMQKPQADEETRRIKERADELTKQNNTAPSKPAESPRTKEQPVPA
jgi:hypothetical protein